MQLTSSACSLLHVAQVSFEISDITTCELADESFDVVYSRDTILHIHDKPALFRKYAEHDTSSGVLYTARVQCASSRADSIGSYLLLSAATRGMKGLGSFLRWLASYFLYVTVSERHPSGVRCYVETSLNVALPSQVFF